MEIYVQKLSNPSEEWTIDVEASDTIEGLKSKIVLNEPSFDALKIKVFYPASYSTELDNNQTISDYGIIKFTHLNCYYDLYVSGTFFDQTGDPDPDVSIYAAGLYKINSDLFNNEPQWYLEGDPAKSHLFYASAPTIGWILTVEMDGSGNSIGCSPSVVVDSPLQLLSSDWNPSLIFNGIFSTNLVISYNDLSNNCNPLFDKFAYLDEDGCERFKRLRLLGYL